MVAYGCLQAIICRRRKSDYSLGAVVGNCGKLLDDVSWGV